MKVLLDPGHGGKFQGACANGAREADFTLRLAAMLAGYLRIAGYDVSMTRTGDDNLAHTVSEDLEARCAIERKLKPALFVSVHCNAAYAPDAQGFEVWTSPGETASDKAAEAIINAFSKAFPSRRIRRDLSDGDSDKESKFRVLTGTLGAAVLVELGFLTNADETLWLKSHMPEMAKAICDGITAFSGGDHGRT